MMECLCPFADWLVCWKLLSWICWKLRSAINVVDNVGHCFCLWSCTVSDNQNPLQPRSSFCASLKGIGSWICSNGGVVIECFRMRRQLVPYLLTWTGMLCLLWLWDQFWISPQAIAPEGVYHLYSLSSNYSLCWSTIDWKVAILQSVLVYIYSVFIFFELLPSSKICTRLLWQHVSQVQDLVSKFSRQQDLNFCLLHFKFLLYPLHHILSGYYGHHKVPIELWWFKT